MVSLECLKKISTEILPDFRLSDSSEVRKKNYQTGYMSEFHIK